MKTLDSASVKIRERNQKMLVKHWIVSRLDIWLRFKPKNSIKVIQLTLAYMFSILLKKYIQISWWKIILRLKLINIYQKLILSYFLEVGFENVFLSNLSLRFSGECFVKFLFVPFWVILTESCQFWHMFLNIVHFDILNDFLDK